MKWPEQKELIRAIPGLEHVQILRYGTIHRNIFLNIPEMCERYLSDRRLAGLYYAGQICGVEGYVESIASAMVVALSIYAERQDKSMPRLPRETMIGSLMEYVHTPTRDFQPMNANMGIMPWEGRVKGSRRARRQARNIAISDTARQAMSRYRDANAWLFSSGEAPEGALRDFA